MTTPAIELTGLEKTFTTPDGDVHAVRGIDLTVPRGEILALLGPNGAGKTTTLDVVLGLTEPTRGSVQVLGRRPRQAVIDGAVSAVLQTGGLLADLTVAETVRWIASTYAEPLPVADVLGRTGLEPLAGRRVSKCSGGEQQKLRFALALVADPDLLVLDEPTAGMDVGARRQFWATMREEAARGRTIVFATHYLEEADAFAERIVLVSGGSVVADGTTEQIRARATGRVVSAEVKDPGWAAERLRDLVGDLGGDTAPVTVSVTGDRLSVRSAASDAVARLLLTELGGRDLEITSGSLDEAFLSLTTDHTDNDTDTLQETR